MAILDEKLLGGSVDYLTPWVDYFQDGTFHEVGTYPSGRPETPVNFRVGFTPSAVGKVKLSACLRTRVGDGNGYKRLIGKCQIVRVAPDRKILMHYKEGGIELVDAASPILRYVDPEFSPICVDTIELANVGLPHEYAVECLGVDGRELQVVYGATFILEA
jgi:hypothetical protein